LPLSGAEQAVVTDLDEAAGEHVLEETTDELFSAEGATLELVSGRLFIRAAAVALMKVVETVVTNRDAADVRGEILEGLRPGAHRLAVDHPVFVPEALVDLGPELSLAQFITKLGAEDGGEGFDWDEEVFAGGAPVAGSSQPTAGDDVVHVGVIAELAGPGMQYSDQAQLSADEPWVLSQLLEGGSGSAEEQIVDCFLIAPGNRAQLGRQGESYQEVMSGQEQVLLLSQPLIGLLILALGTVAVLAGVVTVALRLALLTEIELAAATLGAAAFNVLHGPAM